VVLSAGRHVFPQRKHGGAGPVQRPAARRERGIGRDVQVGPAGFMASEWHRSKILEPGFTEVGVGAEPGPPGVIYVTEVFMKPKQ
jgi:hypothetical protein